MKASPARRAALVPAVRALLFVPLASLALYGCPEAQETTTPEDDLGDVVFGGAATDEALVSLGSALDAKDPVTDPARAPVLDTPTGPVVPASPIPEFSWHFGEAASRLRPLPGEPGPASLRFAAAPSQVRRPLPGSWVSPLLDLVGPPRAAHAHGDPLNGTATFVVFSTKDDPKLLRVFTDQTSFTPGQDLWDKLVEAKAEITVSLVAADFESNRIADGGEPVQGTKLSFTIGE